jgi:hypothetical protein
MESWTDIGTPNGGNGYRDIRTDLVKRAENIGFSMTDTCDIDNLYISHYFSTDTYTPTPSAERYWDEIYVDITRARVELGDRPVFEECSHREIQIPSEWSDSLIKIRVNLGPLNSITEQGWLFVIDKNGNPSDGFPISFCTDNPVTNVSRPSW